jgi:hypothetical protein
MASLQGYAGLNARLQALEAPTLGKRTMTTLGLRTVREAKLLVHRRTGNLGRSIHISEVTPTHAVVLASARYAGYVEYGTRAHEITPKAKKALRWAASPSGARLSGRPRKGAAVVFATRVHHPGTRPYPFMEPGAKAAVAGAHLADIVVFTWNAAA